MQRGKRYARALRRRIQTRTPSNHSVTSSSEPPPPPPPPLEEDEEDEDEDDEDEELEDDEEVPPGVVPEVIGVAQAVVPALAGADVTARVGSTVTWARSVRPWLSVTVTSSVTEPVAG